jgi:diamine N-acetyltransferase
LTWRISLSALTGIPSLLIKRWSGRLPRKRIFTKRRKTIHFLKTRNLSYEHDGLVYDDMPARQALRELLLTERFGRAWWIELDKKTIGYAVLTFGFSVEFHGRDAVLDEMYLLPDHQGKGHFTEVLALIEACCRELGVRALCLVVETKNTRAQRACQKAGFKPHDRTLMTKRLT